MDKALGLEVVGRRVEPSPARTALEWSLAVTFLGAATLAFWQFSTRMVTAGILPACGPELVAATAFLNLIRLERRHQKDNL